MDTPDLIYDWNVVEGYGISARPTIAVDDETLRDGLQSPSVRSPTIDEKLRILHYIDALEISAANIGLPGAGPTARRDVVTLARAIAHDKMRISPNCAARTLQVDIEPIVEASLAAGLPIEAAVFIGSSPIRRYAEEWSLDHMLRHTVEAVTFARAEGLPVMYVTEDTTRAHPDTLKQLYTAAIEAGAQRICLADTVGHATPEGVAGLVAFAHRVVEATGCTVQIDWHGHNDRGLGLINALTAVNAGVARVHGTALGIGERVGNTAIDQLLVNFKLFGWISTNLHELGNYCDFVSRVTGIDIPPNYPVFGRDAYRTATGVHAAAVIKALRRGDRQLADRVYSGVPAEYFGRTQTIEIGPMSGQSNVVFWLQNHGIEPRPEIVDAIFRACKDASCLLTEGDILKLVHEVQPTVVVSDA